MQDSFLNSYPKLLQANTPILTGLWLAHGDEPLLTQWLTDAMRPHWRSQNLAIKHIDLISNKTWQDVLTELNSLSLFDDASAVIITGNHKPDKDTLLALTEFAKQANAQNNQNCLLWLMPKQDKRAQKAKWFSPFSQYGHVIDCHLYDEAQRHHLLQIKAQQFGLSLTAPAWQLLIAQTEHHLLSSYQTLWRLSYLFAPQLSQQYQIDNAPPLIEIDTDALQNALVSHSQYSVFDLSDAMLSGDAPQVVRIIEQLKATDEPTPLVLWVISKEMRLIIQLLAGEDAQQLGIWRSKQRLYHQACQRHNSDSTSTWTDILYRCDQALKGVIRQPVWELLLQSALLVSGHRLFSITH